MTDPLELKVLRFIRKHRLIMPDTKVCVALSGGPDSVLLLHLLLKFSSILHFQLSAAHINHNLRGKESDQDEEFCRSLCKSYQIPFVTESHDVSGYAKTEKLSIEEAGRNLRYRFFEKIIDDGTCDSIATGHHLDDNAETMLMNLVTGTGISGLAGIPIRRGEWIIRPLLEVSKDEVLHYLHRMKIEYVTDHTNSLIALKRNKIRHQVMPLLQELNPEFASACMRTATLLRQYHEQITRSVLPAVLEGSFTFASGKLRIREPEPDIVDAVFGESVRLKVRDTFGAELTYEAVEGCISACRGKSGKTYQLGHGLICVSEQDGAVILYDAPDDNGTESVSFSAGSGASLSSVRVETEVVPVSDVNFPPSRGVEFVDARLIKKEFVLRYWMKGDFFIPLGLKNKKKVSDFLCEQKIPFSDRSRQAVLEMDGMIVWVVGLRLDNRFKVTSETTETVKLSVHYD